MKRKILYISYDNISLFFENKIRFKGFPENSVIVNFDKDDLKQSMYFIIDNEEFEDVPFGNELEAIAISSEKIKE